jgi:hypothetical protein
VAKTRVTKLDARLLLEVEEEEEVLVLGSGALV